MNHDPVAKGRLRARIGAWAVVLTGVFGAALGTGAALHGITMNQADDPTAAKSGDVQSRGVPSGTTSHSSDQQGPTVQGATQTPRSGKAAPDATAPKSPVPNTYATSGTGTAKSHARTQGS